MGSNVCSLECLSLMVSKPAQSLDREQAECVPHIVQYARLNKEAWAILVQDQTTPEQLLFDRIIALLSKIFVHIIVRLHGVPLFCVCLPAQEMGISPGA
jgi:hypothetical protein